MSRNLRFMLVASAAMTSLLACHTALASPVTWDVDPAQSYVRLTLPDQNIVFDGTTAPLRLRNQNDSAWTDAGGRMARLDGTVETDLNDGVSIDFSDGSHNLFALEERNIRPNPASWNSANTNDENPDGQYGNTSSALAALGAKVRSQLGFQISLAFLAFSDMLWDIQSGLVPLGGGTSIGGSTTSFGIQETRVDVDGLSIILVGQLIPDIFDESFEDIYDVNVAVGAVDNLGGNDRRLTYNINIPVAIVVEGITITGNAMGVVVAYATVEPVPEPTTLALMGIAGVGLAAQVYRRRRLVSRRLKV